MNIRSSHYGIDLDALNHTTQEDKGEKEEEELNTLKLLIHNHGIAFAMCKTYKGNEEMHGMNWNGILKGKRNK